MTPEERLVDVVSPLWSEDRAADALGKTPAELAAMAAAGEVLRLETEEGLTFYPVRQFVGTPNGVAVPAAVRAMLKMLAGQSSWAVAVVLLTPPPDHELGGLAAVDAAKEGWPVEELEDFANMVASEWR